MQKDPTGLEPTCLAFVLCEYVHVDSLTSRRTLLGTIKDLWSKSFPAESPKFYVYVALTDGRGSQRISIRLI